MSSQKVNQRHPIVPRGVVTYKVSSCAVKRHYSRLTCPAVPFATACARNWLTCCDSVCSSSQRLLTPLPLDMLFILFLCKALTSRRDVIAGNESPFWSSVKKVSEVDDYTSFALINHLSVYTYTNTCKSLRHSSPPHHGGHFPLPQAVVLIGLRGARGFCRPQIALQVWRRWPIWFHATNSGQRRGLWHVCVRNHVNTGGAANQFSRRYRLGFGIRRFLIPQGGRKRGLKPERSKFSPQSSDRLVI